MPEPRDSISLDGDDYRPTDYHEPAAPPAGYERAAEYARPAVEYGGRDRYVEVRDEPAVASPRRESRIPAHAPRPQDHKPPKKRKKKRERERFGPVEREARFRDRRELDEDQADDDPGYDTVDVEYDGETYTIPADPLDWPFEAQEALDGRQATKLLRALLGPDQYQTFQSKGYRTRHFNDFSNLIAEAGGFKKSGN
jgi:hypothetical protein